MPTKKVEDLKNLPNMHFLGEGLSYLIQWSGNSKQAHQSKLKNSWQRSPVLS